MSFNWPLIIIGYGVKAVAPYISIKRLSSDPSSGTFALCASSSFRLSGISFDGGMSLNLERGIVVRNCQVPILIFPQWWFGSQGYSFEAFTFLGTAIFPDLSPRMIFCIEFAHTILIFHNPLASSLHWPIIVLLQWPGVCGISAFCCTNLLNPYIIAGLCFSPIFILVWFWRATILLAPSSPAVLSLTPSCNPFSTSSPLSVSQSNNPFDHNDSGIVRWSEEPIYEYRGEIGRNGPWRGFCEPVRAFWWS